MYYDGILSANAAIDPYALNFDPEYLHHNH